MSPVERRTPTEPNEKMSAKQFADEKGTRSESGLGFKTANDANQYAAMRRSAWGDNLVYLGAKESDGLFYPEFNLFD